LIIHTFISFYQLYQVLLYQIFYYQEREQEAVDKNKKFSISLCWAQCVVEFGRSGKLGKNILSNTPGPQEMKTPHLKRITLEIHESPPSFSHPIVDPILGSTSASHQVEP
jgi:hypothetical protein